MIPDQNRDQARISCKQKLGKCMDLFLVSTPNRIHDSKSESAGVLHAEIQCKGPICVDGTVFKLLLMMTMPFALPNSESIIWEMKHKPQTLKSMPLEKRYPSIVLINLTNTKVVRRSDSIGNSHMTCRYWCTLVGQALSHKTEAHHLILQHSSSTFQSRQDGFSFIDSS